MKYLYLTPLLFLAACSGRDVLTTAHDLEVKLNGADAAYCILSTPDNRYALAAPGKTLVERDDDDLKIDCKDNNSDRRRTVTISPDFGLGYWTYPESVSMDFASNATTAINSGFRLAPIGRVKEILTEKSYSAPVDDAPKLNMKTYESTMEQDISFELNPIDIKMTDDMERLKEIEIQSTEALVKEMPAPRQYNGRRSYPVSE